MRILIEISWREKGSSSETLRRAMHKPTRISNIQMINKQATPRFFNDQQASYALCVSIIRDAFPNGSEQLQSVLFTPSNSTWINIGFIQRSNGNSPINTEEFCLWMLTCRIPWQEYHGKSMKGAHLSKKKDRLSSSQGVPLPELHEQILDLLVCE